MILRFRHKGLEKFYETGSTRGIDAQHAKRLKVLLGALMLARNPAEMDIIGARLHPLKGYLQGFWSVTVRANWRMIFRFEGEQATDVDLVDYH